MNDSIKAQSVSPFSKSEIAGEPSFHEKGPRLLQPFTFLNGSKGDFRPVERDETVEQANPKDVSAMEIATSDANKPKATEEVTPVTLAQKQAPATTPETSSHEKTANLAPPIVPSVTLPPTPPSAPESKNQ